MNGGGDELRRVGAVAVVIEATLSREVRVAMVAALHLGRRELRRNGTAVPPELDALVSALKDPSALEWTNVATADAITDGDFMSIDDAARRLGVSGRTVRRLVAAGELDSARAGRRVLVPVTAVQQFGVRRGA